MSNYEKGRDMCAQGLDYELCENDDQRDGWSYQYELEQKMGAENEHL